MPELPEVEVIRRDLMPLTGRRIVDAAGSDSRVYNGAIRPENVKRKLVGSRLDGFERLGKFLLFAVDSNWLIFHPRMSGKILRSREGPEGPDGVKLKLVLASSGSGEEGGENLFFTSLRRFSQIYWHPGEDFNNHHKLAALGPDPLHESYDRESFTAGLEGRRGAIKTLLLNQQFIAGLGNIYASEACFRAGIDPRKKVPDLVRRRRLRLYRLIPGLLREAVLTGGSTLNPESSATAYLDPGSRAGSFRKFHRVYDRAGKTCVDCGSEITKVDLAGRSTYFCPECQQ